MNLTRRHRLVQPHLSILSVVDVDLRVDAALSRQPWVAVRIGARLVVEVGGHGLREVAVPRGHTEGRSTHVVARSTPGRRQGVASAGVDW